MVKEVFERMPEAVKKQINEYKQTYKKHEDDYRMRDITRACASAYVRGLMHAGLVNNRERQSLFIYITV